MIHMIQECKDTETGQGERGRGGGWSVEGGVGRWEGGGEWRLKIRSNAQAYPRISGKLRRLKLSSNILENAQC